MLHIGNKYKNSLYTGIFCNFSEMLKLFQNERVEKLSYNQKQSKQNPQWSLDPRMGQQ